VKTTREDICKFITELSDKRMYDLGSILNVATMDYYGGMNSGVGDSQSVHDTEELITMLWECSTDEGRNEHKLTNFDPKLWSE
jgi:hypothetical protein